MNITFYLAVTSDGKLSIEVDGNRDDIIYLLVLALFLSSRLTVKN